MGGKHLKKLRAEKSKVKLKQKQILPKGQNVTNTSFKVKKIITVEQLKQVDENEPVTSWNIPLKDLLIRLNHYNYTSRLNALNGIKELLTNHSEILQGPSLRPAVIKILELVTDPEHQIRMTAINLINFIFSNLSPNAISPFYDILIVHLSCAMTHREVSIQIDSIKFLDIFITYAPEALMKNFQNLIQNFVRILKIYFYGARSELTMSRGSKNDMEKRRVEMFLRFYQILSAAYLVPEEDEKTDGVVRVKSSTYRFSVRSLNDQYKKIPDMSAIFSKSKSGVDLVKSNSEKFQAQVAMIMPLLFDTWSESSPGKSHDGFTSEYVLSENVAHLLLIILKIILLLYEKLKALEDSNLEAWFTTNYGPFFKKSFLNHFPFTPSGIRKPSAIPHDDFSPINIYLMQNLIVSYMYYNFKLRSKNHEYESKIEKFITNSLMLKTPCGVEMLSKVLECVLENQKNRKSETFINTIIKSYNSTNNVDLRRRLFKTLVKIATDERFSSYHSNSNLLKWIRSLPDRLTKSRIPFYLLNTLVDLINKPIGVEVVKEVEKRAEDILNNLNHARIEGVDQFEGQKMVAKILFRCSYDVLIEAVKKAVLHKSSYPPELKSYIINIFSYKLTGQVDLPL